ncbi:MAG TPA: outer membrane protein assembly factor BamE [Gammaproteobacteria bacterium]|nr:outer membrane protein assembly factor BamE [Gammaproteobacteria bacterium]
MTYPIFNSVIPKTLISISLFLVIAACTVHHVDIQQGNHLSEEKIAQLQIGMEKRQVKYILGSPLITDSFHNNRWDYTYYFKEGHQPAKSRGITLYFEGDKLIEIVKQDS